MCMVSNIGTGWAEGAPAQYHWLYQPYPGPTREEFDDLKRDMESLRVLLEAAKRYDDETGQPDCETEEKVALIRRVAELVGVDMGDIFGEPA